MRRTGLFVSIVLLATAVSLGCRDSSTGLGGKTGTLHSLPITSDEVWTLAGSPHTVSGQVTVGGASGGAPVTLTIDSGATVLFAAGAGLTIGGIGDGILRAEGSGSAPISLRGTGATLSPGTWTGVTFRGATQSNLRHVIVTGCGRARTDGEPRGCLVLGHPSGGPDPTILIDSVTIEHGGGDAVILQNRSRFALGSTALSVHDIRGFIATIPAGQAAAFPRGGQFSGIDSGQVRLSLDTLRESVTWPSDIPWAVLGPVFIEGSATPVLTILPGTTLLMSGAFIVGKDGPGGLRVGAVGGAQVHMLPRGADGGGVDFRANAVQSAISDALLDSCGAYTDGRAGTGCIFMWGDGGAAPTPVIQNVVIRNAFSSGFVLSYGGGFGGGSSNLQVTGTRRDTASAWTGTPFFVERAPLSSIPSGSYTGNYWDVVLVYELDIRQDEEWHRLAIPYFVFGGVSVGDSVTHPALAIDSGVDAAFANFARLTVGWTAPGSIRAVGTATAPVTLRGQADAPGTWVGIYIGPFAEASTLFDHAVVGFAGMLDPSVAAAFHFYVQLGPIIRNTRIHHSAGCALNTDNGLPWQTDYTDPALGNTFDNNAGGAQCGP